MKTIQEMLQELSQCIVTVSGEFRFRTNWSGSGKVPQPDLDVFDPNVPFCIENVGDVKANVQYNTKNTNIRISKDYKTWNDYTAGNSITLDSTDRVYIKSDYVRDGTSSPRFVFNGNGVRLRARGNIASLIYGTNDAYVNRYTSTEANCYNYMFMGCTSLTQAPELPATTLAYCCYSHMFYSCISLTQAPELPATTLATFCYDAMFEGCTSLTQAPELPATTLVTNCYQIMFSGCTSLTQAPVLPATTLADSCYFDMFRDCTSLTQAPILPATTLADRCYYYMFMGCTSLTQAPELPATTLTNECYRSMFNGCTKLNYVKCLATNTSATECTTNWLSNVSSTGTFECDNKKYFTLGSPNGIPTGWSITEINPDVEKPDLDVFDPNVPFCIENVSDVQASIQYNTKNTNIRISKDYKTWNDYKSGDSITLDPTDRVYIKSDYVKDTNYNPPRFVFNGDGTRLRARGNIASLIYGTNDAYVNKYTSTEEYCYKSMFRGCTSLTQAPELPATTLAQYCYNSMFYDCASLTQAPELPATTLADDCYSSMFVNCTSLTQAPELPATTLTDHCYEIMFHGCTKLNYVKCLATDTSAYDCTRVWLYNVSATGTFECDNKKYFTLDSPNGIPTGWGITEINPAQPEPEKPDLDTFDPNVPFCIENVGDVPVEVGLYDVTSDINKQNRGNCKISYNLKTWQDYIIAKTTNSSTVPEVTKIALANKGDRVYIKADIIKNLSSSNYTRFTVLNQSNDTKIRARGNIASINKGTDDIYKTDYLTLETAAYDCWNCYTNMFKGCKSLIQAPELPATTLTLYCYQGMFSGCTSLTQAPELPATKLKANCYYEMFSGCKSLTQAPKLQAMTLAEQCYELMFYNCKGLTQAPELPATTLATGCYRRMFSYCASLVKAPELPATILADCCYNGMLEYCPNLTQAPKLPAMTLAEQCYSSMFINCTSLTQTPELPATTLANYCYQGMFINCTSLTQAPELPATTLTKSCYFAMFSGCTSLTQAPELPATTLMESCYKQMFDRCSSLNYVKCLATNISAYDCTQNWLESVASTGDFYAPATTRWTTNSYSGIPSGWTRHNV